MFCQLPPLNIFEVRAFSLQHKRAFNGVPSDTALILFLRDRRPASRIWRASRPRIADKREWITHSINNCTGPNVGILEKIGGVEHIPGAVVVLKNMRIDGKILLVSV
jgi:hypothetical protein